MAWKLCLNYDFTSIINGFGGWKNARLALTQDHLKMCGVSTGEEGTANIAETNGGKTEGDGAAEWDDRQQQRDGKMKRTKENRCMWLNYLLFARCVFVIIIHSHSYSDAYLHLHTLAYTCIHVAHRVIGFAFSYARLMPCNFSMFFSRLRRSLSSLLIPLRCYSISSTKIMARIKTSIKSESATMWEKNKSNKKQMMEKDIHSHRARVRVRAWATEWIW